MFSNNSLKKIQGIMSLAIILAIVALLSSIIKNIVTERWLGQKDYVSCIPADVQNAHPFIYHQTVNNPVQSDALIKSFMEEYVHLVYNEQIVDYHRLTDHDRYKNAMNSEAKRKALNMSAGPEFALNEKRYVDSNEVFYRLQKSNMGWIFNIDDMLVFPGQSNGATLVIVRGSYQVTYDKVKVDLPSELWGYRELVFIVQQMMPTEDREGDVNKHGLFVTFSYENTLSPSQKAILDDKAYNYYLQRDNL